MKRNVMLSIQGRQVYIDQEPEVIELVTEGVLEYDGMVSINDVTKVLQRAEMFARVEEELSKYISELGTDGRLIQMQVEELISNVARDEDRTIMDYENWNGEKTAEEVLQRLHTLDSDELLNLDKNE